MFHIINSATIILQLLHPKCQIAEQQAKGVSVMGRLSLVIADLDRDYLSKLEKFLMVNYPQRFDIYSFSSHGKLSEFLNNPEKRDILLINSILFKRELNLKNAESVILLKGDGLDTVPEGMDSVKKYQHAEMLVSDILRLHSAKSSKSVALQGHNTTRTACILSPAGGTGKSSIAAGCSILCARKGLKTFYLNLEDIPSTNAFFQGESPQSFSNVIYHLKGKGGNLGLKLEGAKCCDSETGVFFYKPPQNALEMEELTAEEVSLLLTEMKSNGLYDVVLVDMPAGLHQRNISVIRSSDVILMMLTANISADVKMNAMLKGLEVLEHKLGERVTEKLVTVYNKCSRAFDGLNFLRNPAIEIREFTSKNGSGLQGDIVRETAFLSSLGVLMGHIMPSAGEDVRLGTGGGFIA